MSLVLATDFPRWTRSKLGLPPDGDLAYEIEVAIDRAVDHVRDLIGVAAYDALALDTVANTPRRKRLKRALVALIESRLHDLAAEHAGARVGSTTQGRRSKTFGTEAITTSRRASSRAFSDYATEMFALGHTVRPEATSIHYTVVER
ncbi:MAG: hypothetical protein H0U69_03700 [Trueperaceae bacterium]|nr:hypothetical protein [Trueperaceae bacterium]